jgi:proline iminopeptidase
MPITPSSEGFVFVRPGLQLYFRMVGEGAETLVIPNANWLAECLAPLAETRRLLFYDPRSRGRSSAVTDGRQLSLEADVQDLEAVRQFFGIERMSLLGSSYHAAITALYASEHPERVERMVLVCPITPRVPGEWAHELPAAELLIQPPGVPRLAELAEAGLETSDPVTYCRSWFAQFLLPAQMSDPLAVERFPVADVASFPNEWPQRTMRLYFEQILPKMGRWDFRPKLSEVQAPTLVVQGTDDLVPVEASREWAAHLGDARFLALEDVGHYPFWEVPDEFFATANEFLAGRWPADSERVERA